MEYYFEPFSMEEKLRRLNERLNLLESKIKARRLSEKDDLLESKIKARRLSEKDDHLLTLKARPPIEKEEMEYYCGPFSLEEKPRRLNERDHSKLKARRLSEKDDLLQSKLKARRQSEKDDHLLSTLKAGQTIVKEEMEYCFEPFSWEEKPRRLNERDHLLQSKLKARRQSEKDDHLLSTLKAGPTIVKEELLQSKLKARRLSEKDDMEYYFESFSILSEARNNEDGEGRKKLNAEKQMGSDSPLSSCHISGLMKYSLPAFLFCLPGVGGSGPEDGQNNQQVISDMYEHTLGKVSHCPSVTEYTQRAFEKCAEICGTDFQDGSCSYHCLRDSYKTSLVEFCGKPQILFDFCPEYDSIGRTIQKDVYTPCNPYNTSKRHYYSSDAFFCDRDNCLRLREADLSTGVSMIKTTTSSGGINDGWLSQYWYILVLIGLVVVLFLVVGCKRLAVKNRYISYIQKLRKRENLDDEQTEKKSMFSPTAV